MRTDINHPHSLFPDSISKGMQMRHTLHIYIYIYISHDVVVSVSIIN
jgi:hypothetical protein